MCKYTCRSCVPACPSVVFLSPLWPSVTGSLVATTPDKTGTKDMCDVVFKNPGVTYNACFEDFNLYCCMMFYSP